MKSRLFLLGFFMLSIAGLRAATITAVVNGGNWSSTSTWSLGRLPQNGDNIVIPAGYTVVFNTSANLTNVTITIAGMLNFNQNNTLALDATSVVNIQTGGTLTATHTTPNELLTINGVVKYNGKTDGTISGPAGASVATGTSPTGFTNTTLPVTFLSFSASRTNGTVQLTWETTSEINNSHFEIQRSATGSDWETIGTVAAGTSPLTNNYVYTDGTPSASETQYRIRQVDLDGDNLYSKVVMVGATSSTKAQPVVATSGKTVSIFTQNIAARQFIVRVISITGNVLRQQAFESVSGRIDLTISTAATSTYVVQITDGNQWSFSKKVML